MEHIRQFQIAPAGSDGFQPSKTATVSVTFKGKLFELFTKYAYKYSLKEEVGGVDVDGPTDIGKAYAKIVYVRGSITDSSIIRTDTGSYLWEVNGVSLLSAKEDDLDKLEEINEYLHTWNLDESK